MCASSLRRGPGRTSVPDWNHTLLTGGYGTAGSTDYVTAASTPSGTLLLAYLPTIRTITVDLTRLNGSISAAWFDPSDGTYQPVSGSPFSQHRNATTHSAGHNTAGASDWVLVLETAAEPAVGTPVAPDPVSSS